MKKTFLLFAIAAVSSQFSVSAQDVNSFYNFNHDFKDSLNVANEGVVTGDVTLAFDAERNSNVAVFNESTNDGGYVTLPAEILNTETLTVSCWAMHNNPNAVGTWGRFWDFGSSNQNYLLLSYSQDNGMKPTVDITLAAAAGARVQSPDAILTGVWHHYVVTYGDGFSRLYMDGVEVNSAENTASLLAIFNSGECTNYLGKSHWPDAALVGRIDDLRTFNKVVSADDVTKLYEGTYTSLKKDNAAVASKIYAANGSIKVDLAVAGKGSIAVYDIAGKKVYGTSSLSASNSIAVKGQGIYIVKLINGGNVTTSKVSLTK